MKRVAIPRFLLPIIISSIAIVLSTVTYGRICETEAQCRERYGQSFDENLGFIFFHKEGYVVGVHFFNGICDGISFIKERGADDPEFRVSIIYQLLDANGCGLIWSGGNGIPGVDEWETPNREITAVYVRK